MKTIHFHKEIFADIEPLLSAAQYDSAKQMLEEIHIEFHDASLIHLQVHLLQMHIARRERNRLGMIGQILPILFAVPTSLVQRYLGLALPSRMGKGGC